MTTIISHLYDKFLFGKFRGETLGDVLMFAPSYLTWVVKNVDGNHFLLMDSAVEEIKVIFPDYIMDDDFDRYRQKQLDDYYNAEDDYSQGDWEEQNSFTCEEEPTYERYGGSYAQDEMGFSDDEIDTIFDGDPSAYWNID